MTWKQILFGVSLFTFGAFAGPCVAGPAHLQIFFTVSHNAVGPDLWKLHLEMTYAIPKLLAKYGPETELGLGSFCDKGVLQWEHNTVDTGRCYRMDLALAPNNPDEFLKKLKEENQRCFTGDYPDSEFDAILEASVQPWTSGKIDPTTNDLNVRILILVTGTPSHWFGEPNATSLVNSTYPPAAPGVSCHLTQFPTNLTVANTIKDNDWMMLYVLSNSSEGPHEVAPITFYTEFSTDNGLMDRTAFVDIRLNLDGLAIKIEEAVDSIVCKTAEFGSSTSPQPTIGTTQQTTTAGIGTQQTTANPMTTHKPVYCTK